MEYFVYILKNAHNQYYIGQTRNLAQRLAHHNTQKCKSTKHSKYWQLVHSEVFVSRAQAMAREKQIKSYKGGEAFKKLVRN